MGSCPWEDRMNAIQKFLRCKSTARNSAGCDSSRDAQHAFGPLNWDAIVATILVIGVGVSFWIGAGLMIARVWK